MPTVRPFPAGGYRFINHQFQYSGGVVAEPGFGIEPHAAPGTMLCTEEFLSERDERNQVLFAPVTQVPMQGEGLLLDGDGVAVIRKNDHEEPVETKLFQAPLG